MTAAPPLAAPHIRARADGDWPAMLDLWVAAWRFTYPEIDFESRRAWLAARVATLETAGARTLCAFAGPTATLAGFVVIDPASGWLDQICVAPDYFGGGLGPALIGAARTASPQAIRLDVNADNARAIRFYERCGFVQTGRGANTLSGRATVMMEWRPAA